MPNVGRGSQVTRKGQHTRDDMSRQHRPEFARDDLKGAYAGNENESEQQGNVSNERSTNVKGRKTKESKTRVPKM